MSKFPDVVYDLAKLKFGLSKEDLDAKVERRILDTAITMHVYSKALTNGKAEEKDQNQGDAGGVS